MPIPRKLIFALFALLSFGSVSFAALENSPLHWSGDKTIWDRKNNIVTLTGNAMVRQVGETVTGDVIVLDLNTRTLDAKGNAVYLSGGAVIHGDEMHFNMDTRTGSVVNGKVANQRFTLTGERINRIGPNRFQARKGAYSTCKDCPQSWTFEGDDVDVEIEGYAYMSNVTTRIKDAPAFWLPYLILPMKSRRQTGFLFPKFSFTDSGFNFLQPFFWAINRSSDMTVGFGEYGGRGTRAQWEGRYKLTERSGAQANFYFIEDSLFKKTLQERNSLQGYSRPVRASRYAFDIAQAQELPWGIDQKFKWTDTSDNLYTSEFDDVKGYGEGQLSGDLIFSKSTELMSASLRAKRFRNLLAAEPLDFDPKTVQLYPGAYLAINDRLVPGTPLTAGLSLGVSNFTRSFDSFDRDQFAGLNTGLPFRPGIDPIRKATRISYTPSLYTSLRPFSTISIVPSAEYRGFFYSFHEQMPNLTRGYLLFGTEVSTQIEKVFETDNPSMPRMKHLFRPLVSYSLIPHISEDYKGKSQGTGHPFLQQIEYAKQNGFSGYNFDSYDIVPRDESRDINQYFTPLGHSVTYGYTTQLIRRRAPVYVMQPGYQRIVEWRSGQSYNFRELKRSAADRQPLSRVFSSLLLSFDKWDYGLDYSYFPYYPIDETKSRHAYSTRFSYVFERGFHQSILAFDRSVSIAYAFSKTGSTTSNVNARFAYSLSDYVMPTGAVEYNFGAQSRYRFLSAVGGLKFQSPSECWALDLHATRKLADTQKSYQFVFSFDLSLNLTGSGFGQIGEFTPGSPDSPIQGQ